MASPEKPSTPHSALRLLLAGIVVGELNVLAHYVLAEVPHGSLDFAVKLIFGAAVLAAIAIINRLLIRYFLAISAKNDDHHHRPTAIALSLGLFVLLICAYAGLYGIEMPDKFVDTAQGGVIGLLHRVIGAVYFSTITISTLGYGDIAPAGDIARVTASLEAVNGLIAFGVFTGAVTGFMATRADRMVSDSGKNAQGHGQDAKKAGD